MQSFIHHEDWDQFSDLFESSIATEKLFIWEGRIIASEKNIKWIEVTGQPVRLEGVKIGWSGVMSDIQIERERQQASDWFRSKDCEFFCDLAGTEQDHIIKLHDNLMYNYNTGKVTLDQVRFAIRKLELKI